MLIFNENVAIYVYGEPVDMRKSIDGLSVLVAENLNESPQSGNVYLFRSKSRDKVKLLIWDRNGFVMHFKRLERGQFKFPKSCSEPSYEISEEQLQWLFVGLDFVLMNEFNELNFENYFKKNK